MFPVKKNNLLLFQANKFRKNDEKIVTLFTNARDEPNIAEWIAHHLLLGFDKIVIFDHMSVEPIKNKLNTNFNNKVSVIRKNGTGNVKAIFGNEAVYMAKQMKASWMLYLDADEFLQLNKYNNVKDFLRAFNFADAIGINWLVFGANGHKTQPKGLLTENFIKSDKVLNNHVKTFVRPDSVRGSVPNAHFYNIINPMRYFAATGNRMKQNPFNDVPILFTKTSAYIAHYYVQSEEEYIRRKTRKMDDGTPPRTKNVNFNTMHNHVVNNQLQHKYSNKIKNFLKKYNIEL